MTPSPSKPGYLNALKAAIFTGLALCSSEYIGAAGLVLDDFSEGNLSLTTSGTATDVESVASVLGGVRTTEVSVFTTGAATAEIVPASQLLDVQNVLGASVVTLTYDGNGAGLGPAGDLGGYDRFVVTIRGLQLFGGSISIAVRLFDADSDDSASASLTADIPAGPPEVPVSIAFADYQSIDFDQLSKVQLIFDSGGDESIDLQVVSFTVVPEPSTSGLALGAVGMLLWRRKRPPSEIS